MDAIEEDAADPGVLPHFMSRQRSEEYVRLRVR